MLVIPFWRTFWMPWLVSKLLVDTAGAPSMTGKPGMLLESHGSQFLLAHCPNKRLKWVARCYAAAESAWSGLE